ncbi:hypothetical protein IV03_07880 [Pseudomonas congelans]|nr:hypothetical protein IV03_07880 [Pseudomonas congelans]
MFASEAHGVGEPLRLNTQERIEAIQAPERVQSERFGVWEGLPVTLSGSSALLAFAGELDDLMQKVSR